MSTYPDDRRSGSDAEIGTAISMDESDLPGDPAGNSARLLPDGTGYTAPVDRDPENPEFSSEAGVPASPAEVSGATRLEDYRATADRDPANLPADAGSDDAGTTPSPAPAPVASTGDPEWTALQGTFVDDPEQAVRDAADRVERQFSEFRSRLGQAGTEQLRTAFKLYRDISTILR